LSREPATLIFDIGKTTKKALVFDRTFHVLDEQTENFKEITDDDGFPCDDLSTVSQWVTEILKHYLAHQRYDINQCNISSYGASLVHLDDAGKRMEPFYNYLKPFPDSCRELFQSMHDGEKNLQAMTASPFLGLLNSGLQLFYLKYNKPQFFKQIHSSLHLPQYFTYLLTGKKFTDLTSVGCHTMLWDFQNRSYHSWVEHEQLKNLFPPLYHADHVFSHSIHNRFLKVGVGVHDSSAALMPYLATQHDPFLLLSTGTWNICFNPYNREALTARELNADCLCFLTFEGNPIKASRIFLGHEHEVQAETLSNFFNVPPDYYKSIPFQENLYRELHMQSPDKKVFFPIGMEGTGPMPEKQIRQTDLSAFGSFEEAYHQLIRYLVKWQLLSIQLLDPDKKVKSIIVVGGFTKNPLFLEILKREETERKILISDHPRASALGAAWLVAGKAAYSGKAELLSVSEV
jgi:L-fuculokinase